MTAIITDVHYRMSLALIRDLACAGVRVVCCERQGAGVPLGFSSKYTQRQVLLPQQTWLDRLYDLCVQLTREEGARPSLLPVGAATLAQLARPEVCSRFSGVCGLCIPTQEQLDLFNDKACAGQLAKELDIPVPTEETPWEGEDLSGFFARIPLPCVVKPLCGEKWGLPAPQRYRIARTPAEAEMAYHHFLSLTGQVPLVQEYLPGGGLGCSVLADHGTVIAAISHRRIREYPVSGGPSSCCECIHRPDLEESAAALVSKTGYTGLAMFEFKEGADGRPRFLEINPRVWGTFPLTRVSRSQIPLLWHLLAWNQGNPQQAQDLPPVPIPQKCRMHFAASDLMSALGYWKQGQPRRAAGAVWDLLRPSVRDGVWEWSDWKASALYYRSIFGKAKS